MVKFSRFFLSLVLFALLMVVSLISVKPARAHGGGTVFVNGVRISSNGGHFNSGSIRVNGVRVQSFGGHGGAVIISGGGGFNNVSRFNQNGGFNRIGRRR